jgi:hypothetical protein
MQVDVNYFPSYKELEDLPSQLRAFLRARIGRHRQSRGQDGGDRQNGQAVGSFV